MTLFICSAGTSVKGGGPQHPQQPGTLAEQIRARLNQLRTGAAERTEDFLVRASAETNGLVRARATADDEVALLVSETDEGRVCAEALCALIAREIGCRAVPYEVAGLQVKDGRRFQREAVGNLFARMDELTRGRAPDEVVFNMSGGFKGTLPYVALYAMVESFDVVYVYEGSDSLIRLPPLPVRFDWDRLAPAARVLSAIREAGAIAETKWRSLLPSDYYARREEYDALFQHEEGEVWLSGPGFLVLKKLLAETEATPVLLSATARQALDAAEGRTRKQFETILKLVRDPLARRAGRHTETLYNCDLLVWKSYGTNPPRMLYWEEGESVRVAELLLHDGYDQWRKRIRQRTYYAGQLSTVWEGPSASG